MTPLLSAHFFFSRQSLLRFFNAKPPHRSLTNIHSLNPDSTFPLTKTLFSEEFKTMSHINAGHHYHVSPKPDRNTVARRCQGDATDSLGPLRNRSVVSRRRSLDASHYYVINAPARRGGKAPSRQTSSKSSNISMSSSHHLDDVAALPENRQLEYSLSKHSMHRSSFEDSNPSHNMHQKAHRLGWVLLVAFGVFMICIHTLLQQQVDQAPVNNMFRKTFLRGREFMPRFGPKTRHQFVDTEDFLSSTARASNHKDEPTKRLDSDTASKSEEVSPRNEPSDVKSLSSTSTRSELELDSLQQSEAERETVQDGSTPEDQPPDSSSVSSEPDTTFETTTHKSQSQKQFCGPEGRNIERPTQSNEKSFRKPIWIAAYPGSGTELFRTLVQGVTGLDADEVYNKDSNFCTTNIDQIAACKTHWPLKIGGSALRWGSPPPERTDHFAPKAVILLRNPAKAIPAHFNYKWEEQHHISDHSQQGSEEDWVEWRDRRFNDSIQAWKRLIETWEQLDGYDVAVYASYEELIREETGPALLQSVAQILHESGNVNVVLDDDIPCLWQKLVRDEPSKKRNGHKYIPSFTLTQQATMLSVVDELKATMAHRPELVSILNQYHAYLKKDLRVEAGGEQATLVS